MKKTISVLLALVLALLCAAPAFAADRSQKNETPVIFLEGFVSSDTVDTETGEPLFPPTSKTIRKALEDAVKPVLKSALRGEFRGLDYPINQAVLSLFDGIRCDENGVPVNPRSGSEYERPTPEQIRAHYSESLGYNANNPINFSYDWRLDLRTLAAQFRDFVEYVLASTGAEKVDVIAYSMGSCVISSYLAVYGGEYIDSLILYLGALNGSSTCGDPFTNNLGMDGESLMATVNSLLRFDLKQELYRTMIDVLYQEGIVDGAAAIAEAVMNRVFDDIYEQSMPYIFGRIPGFWALIPLESYDQVRGSFTANVVTDVFYEKVDFYHDVQLGLIPLLQSVADGGVSLSVVSKYGYPQMPVIRSRANDSDFIIDTKYSSLGATVAHYDETLPADYTQAKYPERNYMSPDRKIDASTCAFPDWTWFIKNSNHSASLSGGTDAEKPMLQWLLTAEGQPTVWDDPAYPQFCVYLPDGTFAPLTAENDWSMLGDFRRTGSLWERIKKIFADFGKILSILYRLIRA